MTSIQSLPFKYQERAIKNRNTMRSGIKGMNYLPSAFLWSDSPEGKSFWEDVADAENRDELPEIPKSNKVQPEPTYELIDIPDSYDPTNHCVNLSECVGLSFRFHEDGTACSLAFPTTSFTFNPDFVFKSKQTGEYVNAKQICEYIGYK